MNNRTVLLTVAGVLALPAFASELGSPLDCSDWVFNDPNLRCTVLLPFGTPYSSLMDRGVPVVIDNGGATLMVRSIDDNTAGILLTAKHLLDTNPHPTRDQIAESLSGNLCRCTGYNQIFEAVEEAASRMRRPR